jgi:hypothetical protein
MDRRRGDKMKEAKKQLGWAGGLLEKDRKWKRTR